VLVSARLSRALSLLCGLLGIAILMLDAWAILVIHWVSQSPGSGSVVHPLLWLAVWPAIGISLVVTAVLIRWRLR
jgi:hypothetical protein